VLIVTMHRFR